MFDKILKTNLHCTKNEIFSTCDQICKKKSLTENFSFCAVSYIIVWCHFGKKLNMENFIFYFLCLHDTFRGLVFLFFKIIDKVFFFR